MKYLLLLLVLPGLLGCVSYGPGDPVGRVFDHLGPCDEVVERGDLVVYKWHSNGEVWSETAVNAKDSKAVVYNGRLQSFNADAPIVYDRCWTHVLGRQLTPRR